MNGMVPGDVIKDFGGAPLMNMMQTDDLVEVRDDEWIFLANDSKEEWKNILSKSIIFDSITINPGVEFKTIDSCQKIWQILSDKGADRKSLLINLGGGVITDMGGFIASTFKRGINFVNIPTTLLSMVDASVGGKTGINMGLLKNQIGIIKEPINVILDPQWLNTLPQKELRSGFAEMLKHGLIADRSYWDQLKSLEHLEKTIISKLDTCPTIPEVNLNCLKLITLLNFILEIRTLASSCFKSLNSLK